MNINELTLSQTTYAPTYSFFFGFFGAACALTLSSLGAAYGTAKSGIGVSSMSVIRPDLIMKSIIPSIMAGMVAIYGLIIGILITTQISADDYSPYRGFSHMASGLASGFAGLSAGYAIGYVGDAGVRANCQQPLIFTGLVLILIFAEALALYGLIIGLIMAV